MAPALKFQTPTPSDSCPALPPPLEIRLSRVAPHAKRCPPPEKSTLLRRGNHAITDRCVCRLWFWPPMSPVTLPPPPNRRHCQIVRVSLPTLSADRYRSFAPQPSVSFGIPSQTAASIRHVHPFSHPRPLVVLRHTIVACFHQHPTTSLPIGIQSKLR